MLGVLIAILVAGQAGSSGPGRARPNVLLIMIDDQNDWIGCLKGHPLAKTPHIDALARRGMLFNNAHCQAPLCNPSRTSLLTGLRPSTTGVHGLMPWYGDVASLRGRESLPQAFGRAGYSTLVTGKIWHAVPPADRAGQFKVWGHPGGPGVGPVAKLIPPTPGGNHPMMDWGAFPHKEEQKGDFKVASWAVDQLGKTPDGKPFFLAAGFFLPHVPCHIPPEWLAKIPDDDSVLPAIDANDRDDTPRFSWYLHWDLPEPRLKWVRENNQWRNLVRSYLACTQFVDAQVGRVLEALKASGHEDDTVVVLCSDHGFHLGEKQITGKNTLWERSTRVPLVIAGPGTAKAGECFRAVELLDIYPTLMELTGVKGPDGLEGRSLVPLLKNPAAQVDRVAITTHNRGNHAVRDDRYRYICYADGSEELYDLREDPREWTNLIGNAGMTEVKARLQSRLPRVDVAAVPGSQHRVLEYDRATGKAVWEGKEIKLGQVVP